MSGWSCNSSTARAGLGWLVLPIALPLLALLVADQLTK